MTPKKIERVSSHFLRFLKLVSLCRGGGPGGMRGPLKEGAPEMNSVHKAEVASIKPFGVFVRMEGYRTNGLVHVSQV